MDPQSSGSSSAAFGVTLSPEQTTTPRNISYLLLLATPPSAQYLAQLIAKVRHGIPVIKSASEASKQPLSGTLEYQPKAMYW